MSSKISFEYGGKRYMVDQKVLTTDQLVLPNGHVLEVGEWKSSEDGLVKTPIKFVRNEQLELGTAEETSEGLDFPIAREI